jgi:hypothetical protein
VANKTLLNAVNEILKATSIIAGDAGLLTTLTDSARQLPIDHAVQSVNEGIDDLYSVSEIALPQAQAEATIILVTGTRAYALAAGVVQTRWPFIDKTNNQYLEEYPGGYNAMLQADPEQNDTGLPRYGAIRPTDSLLHLDRAPTSAENGRTYTYQYDKDTGITAAASFVPFNDTVFRAMVPAWVEIYKRKAKGSFDGDHYRLSVGRASRLLTMKQPRTSYSPRG